VRSARTSTAPCSPATRGWRTGSCGRPSHTARESLLRSTRSRTNSKPKRTRSLRPGPARAAVATELRGPEGTEVDDRVARAPALQEALDRRMQDDVVQLVR